MQRTLVGRNRGTARRAVTANLQTRDQYVKLTIALDLTLEPVEEIAFKFRNLAATQAGHVNMIPLRASLVEVFLPLHVHKIQFINQPMPFQQIQGPINRHTIDLRIQFASAAEELACGNYLIATKN